MTTKEKLQDAWKGMIRQGVAIGGSHVAIRVVDSNHLHAVIEGLADTPIPPRAADQVLYWVERAEDIEELRSVAEAISARLIELGPELARDNRTRRQPEGSI